MKKNRAMRLAALLLVAVLMSTCGISGTFAKYVTEVKSEDSARVAKWGFEPVAMDISDLFANSYDLVMNSDVEVLSSDGADVIAPGTWGSETFAFAYDETNGILAPEVDYMFEVSTTDSSCDDAIKANTNIKWRLDTGAWGTWDELIAAIEKLDGSDSGAQKYKAGNLPAGFTTSDDTHTVYWKWAFDKNDSFEGGVVATDTDIADTAMGNDNGLDQVRLVIKITATQED